MEIRTKLTDKINARGALVGLLMALSFAAGQFCISNAVVSRVNDTTAAEQKAISILASNHQESVTLHRQIISILCRNIHAPECATLGMAPPPQEKLPMIPKL